MRDEANPAPAVSVILPTYNRAYCIRRAIDSVLNQTFTDFELIILDDGSTDDTESVVKSYDDPRIVFIRDTKNRGQTVRLNEGIRAARSALIAFQDSDDEWLPTKLEKQVAAMTRLPDTVGVVYTDKWRHEPGREKYHWKSPHNMPEDGIIFERALDDAVYNIGPQSVLIRRRCFEEVGNFDERITKSNDLEMFIRISQKFRFCHIPEPLVNYFVSGDTMSSTLSEGKGIGAVELILEKFRADIERNPPLLAKRAYWIGSYHMRDGDTKKGRAFLWTAVKAQPGNPRYLAGWLLSQMGRPIYRAAYRLAK